MSDFDRLEDLEMQTLDNSEVEMDAETELLSMVPDQELMVSTDIVSSKDNSGKPLRVLTIGDFHCGHEVGLTPPEWNPALGTDDSMHIYRATMWDYFAGAVNALRPIDILIANGDLIDGRGEKSGSIELITSDRLVQAKIARDIIKFVDAPAVYITRGTDYHVGAFESFEDVIAEAVNVRRIGDVMNIEINGVVFNVRHHVGGSQTPLGRATPALREMVWNELWSIRQNFPSADVILRSHVHYTIAVQTPTMLAMTLPGLQGYGTRYGERRLSGEIHNGITMFTVGVDGKYTWDQVIFPFPLPATSVESSI